MLLLPASMEKNRWKQPRKSGDTVFPIITLSVTMETSGHIWPNVELIQALVYVIITCKHEKDSIKNSGEKWETPFFSHYKPLGIIFRLWWAANSAFGGDTVFPIIALSVTMETSGWIWLNFKLIRILIYVIITCKYETDLIKNSR